MVNSINCFSLDLGTINGLALYQDDKNGNYIFLNIPLLYFLFGGLRLIPEKEFWNKKYSEGGISGKGSIGKYRNWKWGMINQVIGPFKSVIDVGCGDLSFWKHPIANRVKKQKDFRYVGIDISDNIISRNRKLSPKFDFICSGAHNLESIDKAQVVFCLDLLFHIMDEFRFELTLDNLCDYSNEWIVIYTWHKNPFELQEVFTDGVSQYSFELQEVFTDGVSQYYRPLSFYSHIFEMNEFELKDMIKVPFDEFGMLYFFRKLIY